MLKSLSPKGMIKSEQHVTYKNNKINTWNEQVENFLI